MRARSIQPGRGYWVRVRLAPVTRVAGSWGFPGWVGRRQATVVAIIRGEPGRQGRAVVEAERWVCINAHQFGADLSRAMVDGLLRYRPAPHRWTVPVRDVLAPTHQADDVGATTTESEREAA